MSPQDALTRYTSTCTNNCAIGEIRYEQADLRPNHLVRWTAPNDFTTHTSHPSRGAHSDTVPSCHLPGISCSDPQMTYKRFAYSECSHQPACAQTPIMQPLIRQDPNSSVYQGPNLHLYPYSGMGDSFNTHNTTSKVPSRCGNMVHLNGLDSSGRLHRALTQQPFDDLGHYDDMSMLRPDDDCCTFFDFSSVEPDGGFRPHQVYESLSNNPTLAPAPAFDVDYNPILDAHQGNHCTSFNPQDTNFSIQDPSSNCQASSGTVLEPSTPDFHEQWHNNAWESSANSSVLPNTSISGAAHVASESELGCFENELSFAPLQQSIYPSFSASCPPLPDLPPASSPSFQFELPDGTQSFATGHHIPSTHHRAEPSSSLATCSTHCPDAEAFYLPTSSPPDLTSASTTPSRQLGARGSQRNTSTDALLVRMRAEGKSYKEIKGVLGLDEAESTLRGRHRSLTKPKDARVRKPEWKPHDVSRSSMIQELCILTV